MFYLGGQQCMHVLRVCGSNAQTHTRTDEGEERESASEHLVRCKYMVFGMYTVTCSVPYASGVDARWAQGKCEWKLAPEWSLLRPIDSRQKLRSPSKHFSFTPNYQTRRRQQQQRRRPRFSTSERTPTSAFSPIPRRSCSRLTNFWSLTKLPDQTIRVSGLP